MNINLSNSLTSLISLWKNSWMSEQFANWSTQDQRNPEFRPFPDSIEPSLRNALINLGIDMLYQHQAEAINAIDGGSNIVISTGTASGKSLCYSIPILNTLIRDGSATALCLFPTKALTSDQSEAFQKLEREIAQNQPLKKNIAPAIYDGDTPSHRRAAIRETSRILLTNPDMLHIAILPHHTIWEHFLRNLKYIIIDEVHIYRGVFGSHIANLIRRLKRVLAFYGANPLFILTSATIANPAELAERIIEKPVTLISKDAAPKGVRYFAIYNPPIVNPELGIRQGVIDASLELSSDLLRKEIQTLTFCRTRRAVEILLKKILETFPNQRQKIRGYRSGYLKSDRRDIEVGLKNGTIKLAVATNALELGVDIGGMDAILLAGYPGTIAATLQRIGRAGRSTRPSLAVLIASMNPIDQYLARHPDYILGRSSEEALINPDNPLILLQHLQCAAFELSFLKGESFGSLPSHVVQEYLDFLISQGVINQNKDRYYFLSDSYPANSISLRSTTGQEVLLQVKNEEDENRVIGKIDYSSSLWMTHPGAIYLHGGDAFIVDDLDLDHNVASLSPSNLNYYTTPIKQETFEVINVVQSKEVQYSRINYGEINVTTQVVGFKRIQWDSQQVLSIESLDMPPTNLRTFGYWMSLNESCIQTLRDEKLWLSDRNNYGSEWPQIREFILSRDQYRCQNCGKPLEPKYLHVHHKIPFRLFEEKSKANLASNLITLCPDCHKLAELNVKIKSAISGLKYAMANLAPLLVMCDIDDIGSVADSAAEFADRSPTILIYDMIPAGIGLSEALYRNHIELIEKCYDLINECSCQDGCPSCIGPSSEIGAGKQETKRLIELLLGKN